MTQEERREYNRKRMQLWREKNREHYNEYQKRKKREYRSK